MVCRRSVSRSVNSYFYNQELDLCQTLVGTFIGMQIPVLFL